MRLAHSLQILSASVLALGMLAGCAASEGSAPVTGDTANVTEVAAIPFADQTVIQAVSSSQNGRLTTYRALAIKVGVVDPKVRIVIQKIFVDNATGKEKNALFGDQLVIEPNALPESGYENALITLGEHGQQFSFAFENGTCTFDFDGSSEGTPTTREYFKCGGKAVAENVATAFTPPEYDGIPYADGRVLHLASDDEDGRGRRYRTLVVRNTLMADTNVNVVVQKNSEEPKASVESSLTLEPSDLPGGADAQVVSAMWTEKGGDAFTFQFDDDASCVYQFDVSSEGSPTTKEFFSCTPAPATPPAD